MPLNDADSVSGLGGSRLILLTQDEAALLADNDNLPMVKSLSEIDARTFDLEDVVGRSTTDTSRIDAAGQPRSAKTASALMNAGGLKASAYRPIRAAAASR